MLVKNLHIGEHKHCEDNTLTTKSGTFTFHNDWNNLLSRDDAKEFCKKRGEILAPITNWDDYQKIRNFTDGCTNLGGGEVYRIGLDVIDDKNRYFTNGEVYDENVHGPPLYESIKHINTKPACWEAYFNAISVFKTLMINQNKHCLPVEYPFICLKPSASFPRICN